MRSAEAVGGRSAPCSGFTPVHLSKLYDFKKLETAKAVEVALRPILVMRAQARRKPGVTEVDGDAIADGEAEADAGEPIVGDADVEVTEDLPAEGEPRHSPPVAARQHQRVTATRSCWHVPAWPRRTRTALSIALSRC
ncbi:hypothetical protein ENSA7_12940 [Enhygromyxa salina]|uniref:Uncharacterized protein n=1 Tax=Enhygromyxa salina TaxID=215803 RepID=A0A2S9YVB1_9BACT|nr:hypothetical protein ENSA7_12940 [Enhygromyxa salina]